MSICQYLEKSSLILGIPVITTTWWVHVWTSPRSFFFQMATDPGTGFSTGLQAKVRQVTLLLWAGGEYVQRQNFSAN